MPVEPEDAPVVRAMATEIVKRAGDLGFSDDQLMRALIGVAGVMIGYASGGDDLLMAQNIRNLSLSIKKVALAAAVDLQEET